ncbi:MAG: META domain-containing protein [Flavobacteriales bacterium]|nr:META domain-containing protein [Flavobacteriales bacterium]
MRITLYLTLALQLLISCARTGIESKADPKDSQSLWVHSHRTDKGHFLVQFSENKVAVWDTLRTEIQGFDYIPGSLYHLEVEEVESESSDPSFKLLLMKEQRVDPILRIHDIWALKSMPGHESASATPGRAYIELNTTRMSLMGQAHCNSISSSIDRLDEEHIEFSYMVQTKRACRALADETAMVDRLNRTRKYIREGLALKFLDESDNVLLEFKKID